MKTTRIGAQQAVTPRPLLLTAFAVLSACILLIVGPRAAVAQAIVPPEIVLPPALYGSNDFETNLYFDNALLSDYRLYGYRLAASGQNGTMRQFNERFQWLPDRATSNDPSAPLTLTFSVLDKTSDAVVASRAIELRAGDPSKGQNAALSVLFLGDSLIGASHIEATVTEHAARSKLKLTLLGTLGQEHKHEGRGGWSVNDYTGPGRENAPNPFWIDGSVNFAAYLRSNGFSAPDWVFIHLGINDIFGQTSDDNAKAASVAGFDKLDALLTAIKTADARTRIGLMPPTPPSYDQDSFALSEDFGAIRSRFKRNILIWAREMISRYGGLDPKEHRIYIVPSNLSLDTENNMMRADAAPANARSNVMTRRQSNSVHPAVEGYRQIGDAVWSFIKFHL